VSAAPGEGNGV